MITDFKNLEKNGSSQSASYLSCHFLRLFLYMLNYFIASTSVIASSGRTVLLPFFKANPAEVIFTLGEGKESQFVKQFLSKISLRSRTLQPQIFSMISSHSYMNLMSIINKTKDTSLEAQVQLQIVHFCQDCKRNRLS